jgi:hypothetical protein
MRGRFYLLALLSLVFCVFATAAEAAMMVKPEVIGVNLNFSGTSVTVTGKARGDVCLQVTSSPVRVSLNRQGKVDGFWMSVQKTVVEGVPKLCQFYTSSSLEALPASLRQEIAGYRNALTGAKVIERKGEKERVLTPNEAQPFLASLVKLYEKRGLYGVHEGKVKVENGRFTAQVAVPPGTPQGDIHVTAFFFKDGRVIAREETTFTVESLGLVHWLRLLSGTNGPVYGGIAVMIALFAGLAVGMAFGFLDRLLGKGQAGGSGAHTH